MGIILNLFSNPQCKGIMKFKSMFWMLDRKTRFFIMTYRNSIILWALATIRWRKLLSTASNWMSDIFCVRARHLNISFKNCISVDSRISPQDFHFDNERGFVLWKVPSLNVVQGTGAGFFIPAHQWILWSLLASHEVYCSTRKYSGFYSSIFSWRKKFLLLKPFLVMHHPTSCQCEIKIALGGASLCCHSFPSKFVEKSDDADIWAASHNKDEN